MITPYYCHTDQVGSTVVVTNQAGQDVLWVKYDAYGAVTEAVSPTQRDGKPAARPGLNQIADKLRRALSVTPYLYCGNSSFQPFKSRFLAASADRKP